MSIPADNEASAGLAPTRVRYGVLAFLAGMSFILYLDRVCMAQAKKRIIDEFNLTTVQMSLVDNAFLLSYILFEVVVGHWGDRWGSRAVLARIVLCWSIFTALTGAAVGLGSLLLIRFLFGAGEAGAFPNAARVTRRWFPASERGFAQGTVTASAQVGAFASPALAATLIALVGWRWTFVIFGLVGVVWAVAFHRWYRDDPVEHPATNQAERHLIHAGQEGSISQQSPHLPWKLILRSANVWLLAALMACASFGYYFYITWLPTYLQQARQVHETTSGYLTSAMLAGAALGNLLGGVLTDRAVRWTGERRRTLPALGLCAYLASAGCMTTAPWIESVPLVCAVLGLGCFCAMLQIPTWWSACTAIAGRHLGALFGLMNSIGGLGAMLSIYALAALVDWNKSQGITGREAWDPFFWAIAVVQVGAACLWLAVNVSRSAVEKQGQ